MPVVLIVGTSHEFQRVTPDVPPDSIDAFRDYLRQVVVANDVVVIAEEMTLVVESTVLYDCVR